MFRIILAGLALTAFASNVMAATTKAKKQRTPVSIEIINKRAVKLETFSLAAADASEKPLAKLAKPLDGGAKVKLPIAKASGCAFLATWKFEDAGDQAEVDLCRDSKIVLTD